jgi:hypothetical protein
MNTRDNFLKIKEILNVSDDDYLSAVSDKSREDELNDPLSMRTSYSTVKESAYGKNEEPFLDSMERSISDVFTSETTFDNAENKSNYSTELNETRLLNSTSSESDKQIVIISTDIDTISQSQRLDQMDTDSQTEEQIISGKFYIPDDMVDETETQHRSRLLQNIENETNQIVFSDNNQQKLKTVNQFSNLQLQSDNENPNESYSMDSKLTPRPSVEMSLGEP